MDQLKGAGTKKG